MTYPHHFSLLDLFINYADTNIHFHWYLVKKGAGYFFYKKQDSSGVRPCHREKIFSLLLSL